MPSTNTSSVKLKNFIEFKRVERKPKKVSMVILSGLCIFMVVVIGIMAAMALAARGIAEDQRQELEQSESEKEEK